MSDSILTSVKKVLGLDESYTAFDADVTLFINAALSDLNQLGVGPDDGFAITDATPVWTDFLGSDLRTNQAQTYVFLKVKLMFDPPQSGYAVTAMQEQIKEAGWRLNTRREHIIYTDPETGLPVEQLLVLDGDGS